MDVNTFVVKVTVVTLATVLIAVILAMLYGLFDLKVDNEQIFTILGPAFQTIVGVFVGILGGRAMGTKT